MTSRTASRKSSGLGWSSPSVVGDHIYLTTAVTKGEGLSLRAMALSTKDGSTIWDQEVWAVDKAPPIHTKNSHASPTPIVHDGSVYVHFGAQGMRPTEALSGRRRSWTTTRCTETAARQFFTMASW